MVQLEREYTGADAREYTVATDTQATGADAARATEYTVASKDTLPRDAAPADEATTDTQDTGATKATGTRGAPALVALSAPTVEAFESTPKERTLVLDKDSKYVAYGPD